MAAKANKKMIDRTKLYTLIKNYLLVFLGSIVLAFGDAAFITPCNIVSGGVASIGIILNHYLEPLWGFDTNSLVVAIVTISLFVISFFLVGKDFALKTALSSLVFPGLFALFMWMDIGNLIGLGELYAKVASGDVGYFLLAAIFGGALTGTGVALSYLGDGSTGGLDVIAEIIAKHTSVKQDASSFVIDATLVIVGIFVFKDIVSGLVGILSAFACALAVRYVFVRLSSFVIVDIISDKVSEIQDYVHNTMEHATTVIDGEGGYTGEKRKMLRVVIYHDEQNEIRQVVAKIDPKAFMSFTTATSINGEGFEPLTSSRFHRRSLKRKLAVEQKKQQKSLQSHDNLSNNEENR